MGIIGTIRIKGENNHAQIICGFFLVTGHGDSEHVSYTCVPNKTVITGGGARKGLLSTQHTHVVAVLPPEMYSPATVQMTAEMREREP